MALFGDGAMGPPMLAFTIRGGVMVLRFREGISVPPAGSA
jgi:hypothetical protein